ncbi:uncharacterized protein HMPREF1541_05931 [Cyphellophora europaea CBS 101466]|uniref:DDT domain-containing protein n=1 Tax=Cyphellophora europaea (strain CBS 101466) TaxID=1220924 RepID=W2RTQ0_CYPE1|nr:uncharacterized protein HMPREF1541_05931 [Cyphellophora europaea CBS 101466]ETN39705.1 hypothetical protein HMPREF1541_05931 [Cyphellophora europaea CBS 101466]
MVLFKRKAVFYLPKPAVEDDAEDIWFIPQTGEIFTTYESYLQRMDWYKQKRFTCEVSGRSGLSFLDALRSELAGSREVDQAFPDALKGPVLKRVQFSTTSRIDNLVDEVFDDFKNDFYPGEIVTVMLDDSQRLNGRVREKAKFAEQRDADGNVTRKAFTRYFVRLIDRPDEEALADDDHMARDRKIFTKQMLRSFIKNCVTREAWTGAPWLVKSEIAERYHIDSNVPQHLRHSYKVAERKAARKSEQQGKSRPADRWALLTRPAQGAHPGYTAEQILAMQQNNYQEYQRAVQADPAWAAQSWHHAHGVPYPYAGPPPPMPGAPPPSQGYWVPNGYPPMHMQPPNAHMMPKFEPPPPGPPPIKYPIDDMEVPPKNDGVQRPALKYVALSQILPESDSTHVIEGIDEATIGYLLEAWNTLNVYCQVFKLDSFTFDDFVDAMQFSSDEIDCDMLNEVHCAVLKQLVNAENQQNGAIQISLPDLPDPSDDEDDEDEPETREPTPTPEPEIPARRTRSSLNKVQNAEPDHETPAENDEPEKIHRASELMDEFGWIQRLRKREFRSGGWELVLAGLLHQLSGRPRLTESCDKILTHLCPLDAEPTIETVRLQYSTMDINLRALALEIIIQLFMETKAVKTFLDEMSNTMTEFRKTKIIHQRERKDALAKLKNLDIERKLAAPTPEKSPTPMPELEDGMDIDKVEDMEDSIQDSEDEDAIQIRSLRRGHDRAAERKRKRDAEAERKAREAEAKQNKGSKEYQKILKQIDKERERLDAAEELILVVEEDLRQADCTRTRVLGKDRFCNRYWWFERNAMPHAGLPESSTADADYANARIWVQGPDDMERVGYIDVSPDEKNNYASRFDVTPAQRKANEEGPTQLSHANQWGFYDSPEDVDGLIAWLDTRGLRELKLKKELVMQRDLIVKYMENRKAYLAPKQESEEPEEPPKRMATRKKTYISEPIARCTRWENSMAIEENGHKHVEPPPAKKGRGGARKGGSAGTGTIVVEEAPRRKGRARAGSEVPTEPPKNRHGRLKTRQGGRYNW